jgi:5-methylcytosine-specific restriction protein A
MPTIDHKRPKYLPPPATHERYTPEAFYHTPAWKKLRMMHLRDSPLCVACQTIGLLTDCTKRRAGAIDHVIPIRLGGAPLTPFNLMTLCASCHARKSRMESRGLVLPSVGDDGERLPTADAKQIILNAINKT